MLPMKGKKHAAALSASILFTALLFIPIRGGVTVSTMNLSELTSVKTHDSTMRL